MSSSSLPEALASELRDRINSGRYPAGTKLPSEPDLASELGVSRPTLREALRLLDSDGWLSRRHGSGTFVSDRRAVENSLETNFGVGELIRSAGRVPGTSFVSIHTRPADEEVAEQLAVEVGVTVGVLTRVRTADDEPVVHSVDVVPDGFLSSASLGDMSVSLYDLLASAGHAVAQGIARLRPVLATSQLSRALKVPAESALLRIEQTDSDASGRPIVFSVEHYRPDAFDIVVRRQGPAGLNPRR